MWKAWPNASSRPSSPLKALAKSPFQVQTHNDVPSPGTITFLPRFMRSKTVYGCPQLDTARGIFDGPYVLDGRTIVIGNCFSRYSCKRRSSHAILSREYCQYGLASG